MVVGEMSDFCSQPWVMLRSDGPIGLGRGGDQLLDSFSLAGSAVQRFSAL